MDTAFESEDGVEIVPESDADMEAIEASIQDAENRLTKAIEDAQFETKLDIAIASQAAQQRVGNIEEAIAPTNEDDSELFEDDGEVYDAHDSDWGHPDSQFQIPDTYSLEDEYTDSEDAIKKADCRRLYQFKNPDPQNCTDLKYKADADEVKVLLRVIDDVTGKPTLRYHTIEKKKVLLDVEWDAAYGKLVKKYTELLVLCPLDDTEATDIVQFVECP